MNVTTLIMTGIEWCIVPAILLCLLWRGLRISPPSNSSKVMERSMRSAKWAGIVILVLYVVGQKGHRASFSFTIPTYGFAVVPTVLAFLVGFALSWLFDYLKKTRWLGFFVLAVVAAVSIVLYNYIFMSAVRSSVVFWALGVVLGVLIHDLFFPERRGDDAL